LAASAFIGLALLCPIAMSAELTPQAVSSPLRKIELGDQLRVEVFDNEDLTTSTYVGDDGSVRLPLVGAVSVKGSSPSEAARRIESALKDGQFLLEPHVTVTLVESYRAHVTVNGEVATPGRYDTGPGFTVLDAIALAGGVTEKGSDTAYVLRPDASGSLQRIAVNIDMRQIVGSASSGAATLVLQGGDSIVVPKATFTITGQVNLPGEYRIERGMVLFQAIAAAGGVTPLGSASRVEIRRRSSDDKFKELKARKDTLIEPGDVINVKERLF